MRRNYKFRDNLNSRLSLLTLPVVMCRVRDQTQYEYLSSFEIGRAICLKEAVWSNRKIALSLDRSDDTVRRCHHACLDRGPYRQKCSGLIKRHDIT